MSEESQQKSHQYGRVSRIVGRANLVEEGGYLMMPVSIEEFKMHIANMAEDDLMAESAHMAKVISTLTGKDVGDIAIGSRSLRIQPGEIALVLDIDSTDAYNKKGVGSIAHTFDSLDYIKTHCKFWAILKVDVQALMNKMLSDADLRQKILAVVKEEKKKEN